MARPKGQTNPPGHTAGRPESGTTRLVLRPLKTTAAKLLKIAKRKKQTPGQVLDDLLAS